MSSKLRLNPTLFDKLVADLDLSGIRENETQAVEASATITRDSLKVYIPNIQRFNEQALRATVRREVAWLLNTVNLESLVDLTLAIVAINGWNRLSIAFATVPGTYRPAAPES